ncbi:MAG: oligosaccharide flippase family protein [Chromatiaceae bacterium]|nr:oligosaccharide flippase family protein [Chromatiaceae bacterium]
MIASAKAGLRRLLPKNTFARGVSLLVGGTAGAQLLTVLAAPLLTRLYSPEDFGLLAVYGSLLALIGVISSLRYELAIPLPEDDGEAANVAVLSLILVGISALLSGLLVLLLGHAIADALGVPALAGYFWLLPVGVLLGGAYSVFNYWSVRTKRFGTIAGTKLSQAQATVAIQLAGFKLGGIALLYAQVAGQSVGTTSLGGWALANPGFRQVSWSGIKKAAGRYRRFPIFSTWAGFANTAGLQLPPMLFAALFSPAAAGLYTLGNRVLTLPMSLVGGAIGQVFFANAAEAHRAGQLGPLVAQLHAKLAHIGLPPALILILLGPDLFAFVFGEQWRQAGEFARWMGLWLYVQFLFSPLSTLFSILELQKEGFFFQTLILGIRLGVLVTSATFGGMYFTIAAFAMTNLACYGFMLLWLMKKTGIDLNKILGELIRLILIGVACVAPLAAYLLNPESGEYVRLCCFVLSACLLVAWYYYIVNPTFFLAQKRKAK